MASRNRPPKQPVPPPPVGPFTAAASGSVSSAAPSTSHIPLSTPYSSTSKPSSNQRSTAVGTKATPPARRGWNKQDLENGGVSLTLLNTLDTFTHNIPPILNQVDHGKKTHNRDMRGWISSLQEQRYAHLWDSLVNTLRSDSTAESHWGPLWDRHLCRYILGIVVSKDKSTANPDGRSQTRQAVNNAIKRELDCHFEPTRKGNQKHKSARSKTFRDLFREKCREAGVPTPSYDDSKEGQQTVSASSLTLSPTSSYSQSSTVHDAAVVNVIPSPARFATAMNITDTTRMVPEPVIAMTDVTDVPPLGINPLQSTTHHPANNTFVDSLNQGLRRNFTSNPASREMLSYNYPIQKLQPHSQEQHEAILKSESLDVKQETEIRLLESLRNKCPKKMGQTQWWLLQSNAQVADLPRQLSKYCLYELLTILLDFRWIRRTFECVDYSKGMRQIPIDGYDILLDTLRENDNDLPATETEGYRLIRNAIMFTLAILKDDVSAKQKRKSFYAHLATQLTGRLIDLKRRFSNIASLLRSIEIHAPRPWLRPLSRCLLQPSKTDVKLVVPSNGTLTPYLIVLSDDGKLLVTSGSTPGATPNTAGGAASSIISIDGSTTAKPKIHMIRIWDVESGKLLLENKDVPKFIQCLALSRNNDCISFKTESGLTFWHLKSTDERTTISKEKQGISHMNVESITPTSQTEFVLTTQRCSDHRDPMPNQEPIQPRIALWKTTEGKCERIYSSVTSNAECVDVSADGKFFVSGHQNGFIHLWSLEDVEDKPILSFQSAVSRPVNQSVVPLAKANLFSDDDNRNIISICYHERGGSSWVTAVLRDDKIRVWEMPPIDLTNLNSREKTRNFMTTICQAVISKPKVRQVQWSQDRLYTSGDDGAPCEWEWPDNDVRNDWRWYAIEKTPRERYLPLSVSTSLISVGRNSHYVATYTSKSPYVTVWDMSRRHNLVKSTSSAPDWRLFNMKAYRSHMALLPESADAMDIEKNNLGTLEKEGDRSRLDYFVNENASAGPSFLMNNFGDDIQGVRNKLGNYFIRLDTKATARIVGELEPRLKMDVSSEQTSESQQTLEMCFDIPVYCCESGVFLDLNHQVSDSGIVTGAGVDQIANGMENGTVPGISGGVMGNDGRPGNIATVVEEDGSMIEAQRKGMAVVLEGGSVALFELEQPVSDTSTKQDLPFASLGLDKQDTKIEQLPKPEALNEIIKVAEVDLTANKIVKEKEKEETKNGVTEKENLGDKIASLGSKKDEIVKNKSKRKTSQENTALESQEAGTKKRRLGDQKIDLTGSPSTQSGGKASNESKKPGVGPSDVNIMLKNFNDGNVDNIAGDVCNKAVEIIPIDDGETSKGNVNKVSNDGDGASKEVSSGKNSQAHDGEANKKETVRDGPALKINQERDPNAESEV